MCIRDSVEQYTVPIPFFGFLNIGRQIYRFLDQEPFRHDFDNVEYEAHEFDMALGTPNLHTVRRKVEWIERKSVLPPELFQRFSNDAFWVNPAANVHDVPVILDHG